MLKTGATQFTEKIWAKQKTVALVITRVFSFLNKLSYLIKKNVHYFFVLKIVYMEKNNK